MPDNLTVPAVGTVATKEVSNVHHQAVVQEMMVGGVPTLVQGDATHGPRVDTKIGVATTVTKVTPAAGAKSVAAANGARRTIKIHFDGPADKYVNILEGGTAPITADNYSFPIWGGDTYEPYVPSLGEYQAWWGDQATPTGNLRVTQG